LMMTRLVCGAMSMEFAYNFCLMLTIIITLFSSLKRTIEQYNKKAQCFIDQYSNFIAKQVNKSVSE
jgi:F0F1-type ATP synthase membrane subunit a